MTGEPLHCDFEDNGDSSSDSENEETEILFSNSFKEDETVEDEENDDEENNDNGFNSEDYDQNGEESDDSEWINWPQFSISDFLNIDLNLCYYGKYSWILKIIL